jgi:excisionase family DNA binding protein
VHMANRRWAATHESETTRREAGDGASRVRDLAGNDGAPLTTRELAEIIGMSQTFIRNEIRSGELKAVALGRGKKRVFRISFSEAQRYVRQLGLL